MKKKYRIIVSIFILAAALCGGISVLAAVPTIEKVRVRVQRGQGEVHVSACGGIGNYSYSYYLLKDGKVYASEVYNKENVFSFALEEKGTYQLCVYVQDKVRHRTVCRRELTGEDIDELTPIELVLEAEDGICQGDIRTAASRVGFSGTGYVTGFTQKSGNLWQMHVPIAEAGHYTLAVSAASDSYKENSLTINGTTVGKIATQGTGAFENIVLKGVYLEAGDNVFSIAEGWGWFDLDSIRITAGEAVAQSVYNVSGVLTNPAANQKTQAIMSYFNAIYGKKTLAGQYTNHGYDTEVEALYRLTGKYPAVRGFDFIFYSPNSDWPEGAKDTDLALEWDKKGGLSTFSWHWHAPIGNSSFYASETSFDLSRAVTDLDVSGMSLEELKILQNTGKISAECYALVRDIDAISVQLSNLQEQNVTVLWRPLHEASGGWFWWGAKGAEPYKWLWRLMYKRQTIYHKLNNLIWVWNGQDAKWYPGNDVVDIAGIDIYAAEHDYSAQTDMLIKTSEMAPDKPVALTENGVVPDPELLERDNTHWLWFTTWCREFVVDGNGNYIETYTDKEMIKKVYSSDTIITLDELPEFE